jgi:hypothetical protein
MVTWYTLVDGCTCIRTIDALSHRIIVAVESSVQEAENSEFCCCVFNRTQNEVTDPLRSGKRDWLVQVAVIMTSRQMNIWEWFLPIWIESLYRKSNIRIGRAVCHIGRRAQGEGVRGQMLTGVIDAKEATWQEDAENSVMRDIVSQGNSDQPDMYVRTHVRLWEYYVQRFASALPENYWWMLPGSRRSSYILRN